MYSRNSRVKFGRTMRKIKALSITQKKDLKEHKDFHLQDNPVKDTNRHITIMSDLMKQGDTFNKSHIEAQKLEPMKKG